MPFATLGVYGATPSTPSAHLVVGDGPRVGRRRDHGQPRWPRAGSTRGSTTPRRTSRPRRARASGAGVDPARPPPAEPREIGEAVAYSPGPARPIRRGLPPGRRRRFVLRKVLMRVLLHGADESLRPRCASASSKRSVTTSPRPTLARHARDPPPPVALAAARRARARRTWIAPSRNRVGRAVLRRPAWLRRSCSSAGLGAAGSRSPRPSAPSHSPARARRSRGRRRPDPGPRSRRSSTGREAYGPTPSRPAGSEGEPPAELDSDARRLRHPAGRLGDAADIAAAVGWLLSDDA